MEPKERVLAYVTGYFETSERLYERVSSDGDFDAWSLAIDDLEAAHCIPGAAALDRYSVSSLPKHDPNEETVLEEDIDGDTALVLTQCGSYRYFDYTLERVDGDWRIAHIQQTASHPLQPLVKEDDLERHLAAASESAEFEEISPQEDPSNSLFEHGRPIEKEHEAGELTVRRVGELNVTSGVLAVQDFGYDGYDLLPLERKVPPGRYPVEVSSIFGRNAALRILFGDPETVASWHPANVPDSGHVCGVDAGNLAVFDLASFATLTVRTKEALYEDAVVNPKNYPLSQMLTMLHEDDGVVAASGWGDGAYPVHWGVDKAGQPVVLLLDFLIACSWPTDEVDIVLTEENVGEPVTARGYEAERLTATFRRAASGGTLEIPASCRTPFTLVDDDGKVLAASSHMKCSPQGGDLRYPLSDELADAFPFRVRFEVVAGYRN